MNTRFLPAAVAALFTVALAACGGSGGTSSPSQPVQAQSATVPVVLSDGAAENWSAIGVRVLRIELVPQGGGSPVTVYAAPNPAPLLNLAQLDQIGELLGNATIPTGTYTAAQLTIGANPGDVLLNAAADPASGFAAAAGARIPSQYVQVQGARGASGARTVQVTVDFSTPLVVDGATSNALQIEFDLSHPAFVVDHTPVGFGQPLWGLNFAGGPVRHVRVRDVRRLVLRHSYGKVTSVATGATGIVVEKYLPTLPIVSPETGVATGRSLTVLADAANGTLFHDVDAKTAVTIRSFSSESSLPGRYVRVAARYQQDGSLVATRIWAGDTFDAVFAGPEGHVVHVDAAGDNLVVDSETGRPVRVKVDASTQFYFRNPANPAADSTPIGQGPSFMTRDHLRRGFKVHVSVVDPDASPLVAQSVEIQAAPFEGRIVNPNLTQFSYAKAFRTFSDDYSVTLPYIAASSPNGDDAAGNAITGFKYWDFAYPTRVTSGAGAVQEFVAAASAGANFGGTTGRVPVFGATYAVWGDAANPTGWSAPWVVLQPTALPRGTVATGYAGGSFTMSVRGGTTPVTIGVSTTRGSATLVYQVDRVDGRLTVTPEDITTSAGLAALTAGLSAGNAVRVYGVPQSDGSIRAYVLTYYTGEVPLH